MCALIAALRRGEVAGLVRGDDRLVLGGQVRAALELAAADHLHHQVDRELAVEAREQGVAGEVDLMLVEGGVRRVPLRVRDRVGGRVVELAEAAQLGAADLADGALGRLQLEREPHVVALRDRRLGQRRDVVAAPRLHGQQALGDEPRQRVVDGAARDTERRGQLVQAHLLARAELAADELRLQRLVDAVVQIRPGLNGDCHAAIPNMTLLERQPADVRLGSARAGEHPPLRRPARARRHRVAPPRARRRRHARRRLARARPRRRAVRAPLRGEQALRGRRHRARPTETRWR